MESLRCSLFNCGSGLCCSPVFRILAPRPGIEPMSPTLHGRLPTTGPSGKSLIYIYIFLFLFFLFNILSYLYFINVHEFFLLSYTAKLPRIELGPLTVKMQSSNHWTARELSISHTCTCAFICFCLHRSSVLCLTFSSCHE